MACPFFFSPIWFCSIPIFTNYTMKLLQMVRALLFCCVGIVAVATTGCGESGPATYPVTGTVTFDGAPVEEGRITFRPVSGAKAFAAEIKNGEYSFEGEPGKMAVEVTASRIIPGKFDDSNPDDEPQPVGEMYIPEQYNAKTTLEAEIQASGENKFNFDLKAAE
ncbi:MAG: hypothetical protein R3C59_14255 [Planctomycetaceae bacterium]